MDDVLTRIHTKAQIKFVENRRNSIAHQMRWRSR